MHFAKLQPCHPSFLLGLLQLDDLGQRTRLVRSFFDDLRPSLYKQMQLHHRLGIGSHPELCALARSAEPKGGISSIIGHPDFVAAQ